MPLPRFTPWKLAGSAGLSVNVGTPVAELRASLGYLYMPLQHQKTGKTLVIKAVGIGAGAGVSATPSPVHISGRLPNMPSAQLGTLIAGIRAPNPMSVADLKSYTNITIFGADAAAFAQGGYSVALFTPPASKFSSTGSWGDWITDAASTVVSAASQGAGALMEARAICIWAHTKGSTNVNIAGRIATYGVVSHRLI